ncbi:SgcJ/EcaC family oxidoreductase [Streptomyces sp. NPDC003691]
MASSVLVVGDIAEPVRAAVTGVVKALEKAFNDKDPVALSEQFAERASWSNARGLRLDDRQAIADFSGPAMKSFLRDSHARYEVVKLLELAPGVIAVNVVQTPADAAGGPVAGPWGATLYVISEQPDGWKIVAGQNTAVDAPAG